MTCGNQNRFCLKFLIDKMVRLHDTKKTKLVLCVGHSRLLFSPAPPPRCTGRKQPVHLGGGFLGVQSRKSYRDDENTMHRNFGRIRFWIIFLSLLICRDYNGYWAFADTSGGSEEIQGQQPLNVAPAPKPMGLTLSDCYRLALKQSEKVAVQQELINQAEGQFLQSLSTILPAVDFSYTEKRQNISGGSSKIETIPEGKFVFSQPLFSGFKEFAAIAASRAQ